MEQPERADLRVKVVHKAKEATKVMILNQAASDILLQFKRLVVDAFSDLAPHSDFIRLEYKDAEVVDDDGTLRTAIAEFIASGQVPKFWVSYLSSPGPTLSSFAGGSNSTSP